MYSEATGFYDGQVIETSFGHVVIIYQIGNSVMFRRHYSGSPYFTSLSEFMDADEFKERFIINSRPVRFVVNASRSYGQPKLTKPKELKGKTQSFSVEWCKNCKCQGYIDGNNLWIKHRDWFSRLWQPPADDIGKPQNHYLQKYFGSATRPEKFIYSDNWGGIVLRGEAWIKLENVLPTIQNESPLVSKEVILKSMSSALGLDYLDLCVGEWERFWESVVNAVLRK